MSGHVCKEEDGPESIEEEAFDEEGATAGISAEKLLQMLIAKPQPPRRPYLVVATPEDPKR